MAQARRFDHFLARRSTPVEVVPGSQSEFTEELALCSPVALAKGMRRIQLAQIIGRALNKLLLAEARQKFFLRQLFESLLQGGLKKCSSAEKMPAFGNVHSAELTRPIEDVLEDVAMDRFEMCGVELAGRWGFDQLGEASMRASSLERVEFSRISET